MDLVLVRCLREAVAEMRQMAERRAVAELASEREQQKTEELDQGADGAEGTPRSTSSAWRSWRRWGSSPRAWATSCATRWPPCATRMPTSSKRLARPEPLADDARVPQFLALIDRELNTCAQIISDLLDFARERPLSLQPCPLRPLVDEAIGVVPLARAACAWSTRCPRRCRCRCWTATSSARC